MSILASPARKKSITPEVSSPLTASNKPPSTFLVCVLKAVGTKYNSIISVKATAVLVSNVFTLALVSTCSSRL